MEDNKTPFAELPAALVEDVLTKTKEMGEKLLREFESAKANRSSMREQLLQSGILMKESSLGYPPLPTTCAADGSYAIERLLTVDLAAAAAVAVEGLTPPSEKRYWDEPRHKALIFTESHQDKTATILRAAMLGEELLLACKAPHDLVLLDFTLTLPVIYLNQGFSAAGENPELDVSKYLLAQSVEYLSVYRDVLRSTRSNHQFAGIPKYSTRREIANIMRWPRNYDDRAILTLLMESAELTKPILLEKPTQEWHLGVKPIRDRHEDARRIADEIVGYLNEVHIFYYKPHDWLPALRVEVAREVAANNHRLATVVQGLKHQCATPSMLEPYPLYLADRTVKALARALPTFRQVTTQHIAEHYAGDVGEVFFAMHGYRSEEGR